MDHATAVISQHLDLLAVEPKPVRQHKVVRQHPDLIKEANRCRTVLLATVAPLSVGLREVKVHEESIGLCKVGPILELLSRYRVDGMRTD